MTTLALVFCKKSKDQFVNALNTEAYTVSFESNVWQHYRLAVEIGNAIVEPTAPTKQVIHFKYVTKNQIKSI